MAVAVLQGFALFLIIVFLSYITMTAVPYLRRGKESTGDPDAFQWHFFVPARDEEAVIEATVSGLRNTFPQAHVWAIDDGSTDDTRAILDRLAEHDPLLRVVRRDLPEARQGKGAALNHAYRELVDSLAAQVDHEKVIVCVVDADGELEDTALAHAAADRVFGDPVVGGAQLLVRMANRGKLPPKGSSRLGRHFSAYLVRMQDLEFAGSISAMQILREHTGTVGLGGNGQFTRLSVLDELTERNGSAWHGALLEDFELGLHILMAGYQNRYIFHAEVRQEGLESFRRLLAQRARWSQGTFQCSRRYFGKVLRSSNLSNAGALEASYFLIAPWTQLVGVLLWPVIYGALIVGAIRWPGGFGTFAEDYWYLFVLSFATGILPFVAWGPMYKKVKDPDMSWLRAIAIGFGYWIYLYYTYPTTVRAVWRMLRGNSGWAKTRRNAEEHVKGKVAVDV